MEYTIEKVMFSDNPFLTIVTRCYKRPKGFAKNQESIRDLTDNDGEQIFIFDNVGHGLLEANRSFSNQTVIDMIEGQYVFLLDDDDFIVNPNMITELKNCALSNPEVIFFRMTIKNGMNNNHYPTDELCWGVKPIIARIGGSCFVVRTDIYKKFIHEFAKPRCGDFYFIDAVFKNTSNHVWYDKLMCETGKVSYGKAE